MALIRGSARKGSTTIGNFVFMAQGALETLGGPVHVYDALNGARQVIPRGTVASQEVIKQFGTNGGGFFNANGASLAYLARNAGKVCTRRFLQSDPSIGYRLSWQAAD